MKKRKSKSMIVYNLFAGTDLKLTTIVKEEAEVMQASLKEQGVASEIKTETRNSIDHSKLNAVVNRSCLRE